MQITLIDKSDVSDPATRETFRMHMVKILAPYGLNAENGIKMVFLHEAQFQQVWYLLV